MQRGFYLEHENESQCGAGRYAAYGEDNEVVDEVIALCDVLTCVGVAEASVADDSFWVINERRRILSVLLQNQLFDGEVEESETEGGAASATEEQEEDEQVGGQLDGADDYEPHAPSTTSPTTTLRPRLAPSNTTSSEGQDVEHHPGPAERASPSGLVLQGLARASLLPPSTFVFFFAFTCKVRGRCCSLPCTSRTDLKHAAGATSHFLTRRPRS